MTYIYLDESGDLGFNFSKKDTTEVFVIAFLVTNQIGPIEKILKKLSLEFKKASKKIPNNFHSHKETDKTRLHILKTLSSKEVELYILVLDKKKTTNGKKSIFLLYRDGKNIAQQSFSK